uniref:Uncharacterized protein n=1 Tax=Picea glauca TaxID=3330 RepID=A0A124GNJ2_PICGL|nr:hypothetical protein ABT39_MTgene4314 [Picea glauca]QHR88441.1 hypothetical protein Q903MT_gene2454 [Picea sitchensis]
MNEQWAGPIRSGWIEGWRPLRALQKKNPTKKLGQPKIWSKNSGLGERKLARELVQPEAGWHPSYPLWPTSHRSGNTCESRKISSPVIQSTLPH